MLGDCHHPCSAGHAELLRRGVENSGVRLVWNEPVDIGRCEARRGQDFVHDGGKIDDRVYTELSSDNPIDLTRYQVANCYMGRAGLINSGGESKGSGDLADAVRTAVVNKRGGGTGLISGRKAFQRPMKDGVELLNAIQDVYLTEEITAA